MSDQPTATALVSQLRFSEQSGSHARLDLYRKAADEIERLRAAIDAAVGEFDRGKPMSALNFLLNAQEGLP